MVLAFPGGAAGQNPPASAGDSGSMKTGPLGLPAHGGHPNDGT